MGDSPPDILKHNGIPGGGKCGAGGLFAPGNKESGVWLIRDLAGFGAAC